MLGDEDVFLTAPLCSPGAVSMLGSRVITIPGCNMVWSPGMSEGAPR